MTKEQFFQILKYVYQNPFGFLFINTDEPWDEMYHGVPKVGGSHSWCCGSSLSFLELRRWNSANAADAVGCAVRPRAQAGPPRHSVVRALLDGTEPLRRHSSGRQPWSTLQHLSHDRQVFPFLNGKNTGGADAARDTSACPEV
eukprot:SAG11_NODE_13862_length_635_cov_3.404851_1_plen_143_part_00